MKITLALPFVLSALSWLSAVGGASAQSFSIDRFAIAGGGVTFATGGPYSLGGTLGQPAVGVSTGGNYELAGGFWAGAISLAPTALLTVTTVAGEVQIGWPAPLSNWVLEGATTLGPVPDWAEVVPAPVGNSFTTPVGGGLKFFRLRKP